MELDATPQLTIELGWNAAWRHRLDDAVYSAPLIPVPATTRRPGRFTGHQTIVGFIWQTTHAITLSGEYVYFEMGDALPRAGGRNVDFLAMSAAFRF